MIIVTSKLDDSYRFKGNKMGILDNGYPYLIEENVAFPPEFWNMYSIEGEIPAEVEFNKYCYTEKDGFYENPNWHEPTPFDDPQYAAGYEQALLDLAEEEEAN